MSAKSVNDIRNEFLGFFKKNGHEVVDSSPLVPHNDPTLMFTNAGMVQFKDVFTGKEKRNYTRATTSQKCVRAGGKHNDLENVGYTARHHTFFEMLGNFSFGDYFKEEAISFAWELVSKKFAMPRDKLLVTVHSTDEEAADLWKKIAGFSDERIIRIPTDDNFWRMGDTGPCGPCTEIFYDQGEALEGGPPGSPDEDGDRFLEFWNLVFMQFEQLSPDERINLPAPSVDTGMGLERTAALMQGKFSNYDIDLLRSIIEHSADLTGIDPDGDMAPSHRVIADHLRCAAFLLADGVMPSNEGRGYVLRRIMRRGMRHAHLLGAQDPLMYKLLPTLISSMGEAYPELIRAQSLTTEILKSEEERFKITLERGLKMLDEETEKLSGGSKFPGDVAFKLYDTFGFPLDLTQDALKAKNIEVDEAAFDACMEEQKAKARAAWAGSGEQATEKLWFDILEETGPTEFLGYEAESAEGQVLAIVKKQRSHPIGEDAQHPNSNERDPGKDGSEAAGLMGPRSISSATQSRGDDFEWVRVDTLKEGEEGIVITNQTPFYAESGGQVGDTGEAQTDHANLTITNTKKQVSLIHAHYVKCNKGEIKLSQGLQMQVNRTRRAAIRANHSATHLLHEALRRVLGEHVTQKGSLQDDARTRFDISHPKAVTTEELEKVESLVNEQIKADTEVVTRLMPLEEARETGAMALFGEKYADEVRVVSMGTQDGNRQFSVELCGGTHVKKTGQIERLKIIAEGALSAGVRRVEAVTGARADAYESEKAAAQQEILDKLRAENEQLKKELAALGGAVPDEKSDTEGELIKANKKFKKMIDDLRRSKATQDVAGSKDDVKELGGVKFIGKVLEGFPPKDLKPMADDLKKKLGSGVIALVATNEGKASVVVGVTEDLTGKINAVDLVKTAAEALGGKGGGGRPDMAQAGGPDAGAANDTLTAIEKALVG